MEYSPEKFLLLYQNSCVIHVSQCLSGYVSVSTWRSSFVVAWFLQLYLKIIKACYHKSYFMAIFVLERMLHN